MISASRLSSGSFATPSSTSCSSWRPSTRSSVSCGAETIAASSSWVCGLARAVAVVVGREVVRDPDQPRAQRPAVRLALRALEMPVGLKEGLLGEVLGVVVVAHPVVGVAVDVAQVGAIQLGEVAVEPRLSADLAHAWSSLPPRMWPLRPRRAPASRSARAGLGRHRAAEPRPLELDAGPDPRGHLVRQVRGGVLHARVGERAAAADVHPHGPEDASPRRARSVPVIGDRHHRRAALEREPADAALGSAQRARSGGACPRGRSPPPRRARAAASAVAIESSSDSPRRTGKAPRQLRNQPMQPVVEQLLLRHEVDRAAQAGADHERVEEAAVVGREDHLALRDVLAAGAAEAEEDLDRAAGGRCATDQ